MDWDALNRREDFTIDDGSGPRTAKVTTSYVNGVWVHFPVNVPAGGSIQIDVTATGGLNGVLSGIFLGGSGPPLPPPPPGPPTLTATGAASAVSLSWTAASSSSPVTNYKVYRGTTPAT
ncbi:MAG: hypothetical protein E6I45_13645 [Chloroflexi bacterium]|nr:MAG: hypothetical protein E6I45_13645 [Chloroflexota bacterium]